MTPIKNLMTRTQLITNIAKAIAKMEGFNILNSISRKNCNPGNLRSWPKTTTANGYAKFERAEDGWKALYKQIETNIFGNGSRDVYPLRKDVGLSLKEFFGGQRDTDGQLLKGGYPGYAPAADSNQPMHYAKYVAAEVGLPNIETKLKEFIDN